MCTPLRLLQQPDGTLHVLLRRARPLRQSDWHWLTDRIRNLGHTTAHLN